MFLCRSNDWQHLESTAAYVRSLDIITFAVGVKQAMKSELQVSQIYFHKLHIVYAESLIHLILVTQKERRGGGLEYTKNGLYSCG